jgi:hypothetical protein
LCAVFTFTTLFGCAPIIESTRPSTISAKPASTESAVVTVTGVPSVLNSSDYNEMSTEISRAIVGKFGSKGIPTVAVEDQASGGKKKHGVKVLVTLQDYHRVSQGMRIGFGIMTGNAYINGTVELLDLQTGERLARQDINTSSSAWQGVFGSTTSKQVKVFADEVYKMLNSRG